MSLEAIEPANRGEPNGDSPQMPENKDPNTAGYHKIYTPVATIQNANDPADHPEEGSHRIIAGLQDPQDSDEGLTEDDPSIEHPVLCFERDLDAAVSAGQLLAKQGYAECPGEPALWMVNKDTMAKWVGGLHEGCQDLQTPNIGRLHIAGNLWELLHQLPGGEGLSIDPLLQRQRARSGAIKAAQTIQQELLATKGLLAGIENHIQAEAAYINLEGALDTVQTLITLLREGGDQ